MAPKTVGTAVRRNEDARLLTGRALFVDDVQLPGMLHVAFVRSHRTRTALKSVDVTARAGTGLASLRCTRQTILATTARLDRFSSIRRRFPATCFTAARNSRSRVRKSAMSAKPIAMIVATSRYVAEDACADVVVDVDPIDAVVDLEAAMKPGAPLVHPRSCRRTPRPTSCSARATTPPRARTRRLVVRRRFLYDRGVGAAIENRAVAVDWNARAEELTIWDTTQAPIPIRNGLARSAGPARVPGTRRSRRSSAADSGRRS